MVNLKDLTDSDLMKLRDDVSSEILLRNYETTPDKMVGLNMERAAHFLSFDLFTLEQCLIIAKNLLKTIEQKTGEKQCRQRLNRNTYFATLTDVY